MGNYILITTQKSRHLLSPGAARYTKAIQFTLNQHWVLADRFAELIAHKFRAN